MGKIIHFVLYVRKGFYFNFCMVRRKHGKEMPTFTDRIYCRMIWWAGFIVIAYLIDSLNMKSFFNDYWCRLSADHWLLVNASLCRFWKEHLEVKKGKNNKTVINIFLNFYNKSGCEQNISIQNCRFLCSFKIPNEKAYSANRWRVYPYC